MNTFLRNNSRVSIEITREEFQEIEALLLMEGIEPVTGSFNGVQGLEYFTDSYQIVNESWIGDNGEWEEDFKINIFSFKKEE